MFSGYWPDSSDGPDAEGWFATGDVAIADFDGDLRLVDRRTDLILVSGFNVYPAEVEGVIAMAPGVREVAAFEGQAAMLYESQALQYGEVEPMQDGFALGEDGTLDLLPLLGRLADERDTRIAAALFHATLAAALAEWARRAAEETGLSRIALGGGCFLNRILSEGVRRRLETAGLEVLQARRAPPNDGGLSLGQAWVVMQSGG